ncbi:phosphatase [Aureococcus anophagefferens]|nr:phosphatase [Aureococcus anophagefferens]
MARVGAPHGRGGALSGDEERPCVEAPEIVRRGSDLRRESIPEDEEAAWPDSDDERDPGGADLRRRGTAHHTRGEFHRRRDSHEQNLDMTVPNKRRLSHSLPELKLMDKVQQFLQDNPPVPAAAPADEHPGNGGRST